MSRMPCVLTDEVRQAARRSVLCWLATVDDHGQPNVSPKEVWAIADDHHVVVANIASPVSVRNIAQQPLVCLSFVDVLVQKGFKLQGTALNVTPSDLDYANWARPLLLVTGDRFPVHSVVLIQVQSVQPIVAPSYCLYPDTTTEAGQVASARRAYGLDG
jgi:predicted pyridoxine 5'-phosphate oxidase superfamily flavin-nucleotide-binding protein